MQISSENKLHVLGLMSGTSLDGLDIASVVFDFSNGKLTWMFGPGATFSYTSAFRDRLQSSTEMSALELRRLDIDFATLCSTHINSFLINNSIIPDLIASHGHTVFHDPQKGYTLQIGCGATIASLTGINTVSDFRQQDVALGGQGAPLVPVADALLFNEFDVRINLGGFANYSYGSLNQLIAGDICPLNIVLNTLCKPLNHAYDAEGSIARSGSLIPKLFDQLQGIDWYKKTGPKSLGVEWVRDCIFPILNEYTSLPAKDVIHTFTMHAAHQICQIIPNAVESVLCTGGGTHNDFLIEQIRRFSQKNITVPNKEIIDFKEAISFALLGALRFREEVNIHKSVTGASKNLRAGAVYLK